MGYNAFVLHRGLIFEVAQAIKAFAEKLQPQEKQRELRKDRDIER